MCSLMHSMMDKDRLDLTGTLMCAWFVADVAWAFTADHRSMYYIVYLAALWTSTWCSYRGMKMVLTRRLFLLYSSMKLSTMAVVHLLWYLPVRQGECDRGDLSLLMNILFVCTDTLFLTADLLQTFIKPRQNRTLL